jgi:NDP-sugar pyrophosphorylase family protein
MSQRLLQERALILAGGLGTRLSSVLADRPKVLAPIATRPFLDILIEQLLSRGVRHFVLLLGNRADQVISHVKNQGGAWPADVDVAFSVEASPLGTGGAVKLAERFCTGAFLLLNGDTYFDLDMAALLRTHHDTQALITMAAAEVSDADRYGRLEVSDDGWVRRFREKDTSAGPGLINAGVYLMSPAVLGHIPAGRAVSLESEVFPALLKGGQRIAVSAQQGTFFDIGTPSSYRGFVDFCREKQLVPAGRVGSNHDQH